MQSIFSNKLFFTYCKPIITLNANKTKKINIKTIKSDKFYVNLDMERKREIYKYPCLSGCSFSITPST